MKTLLVGMMLLFYGNAFSQQSCNAYFSEKSNKKTITATLEQNMEGYRVQAWSYLGRQDFESAFYSEYTGTQEGFYTSSQGLATSNGHFQPTPTFSREYNATALYPRDNNRARFYNYDGNAKSESLLARLQRLPLEIMKRLKYIDEKYTEELIKKSHSFHPDQITFFETLKDVTAEQLEKDYPEFKEFAYEEDGAHSSRTYHTSMDPKTMEIHANDYPVALYTIPIATTWLISANDPARTWTVPLQKPGLQKQIDRKEYPWFWEVGRASQLDSGKFNLAFRFAVYQAYMELLKKGGKLEDASIFAHSGSHERTTLYRRSYGMKIFSSYEGHPEETVLVTPLKDLLEWAKIDELVLQGEHLKTVEDIQNHFVAKTRIKRYFSWKNPFATNILVRDFTETKDQVSPSSRVNTKDYESQHISSQHDLYGQEVRGDSQMQVRWNGKQIFGKDRAKYSLDVFLKQLHAIEIYIPENESSFRPTKQNIDTVLKQVVKTLKQELSQAGQNPEKFLREHQVRFAVTLGPVGYKNPLPLEPIGTYDLYQPELVGPQGLFGQYMTISPMFRMTSYVYETDAVLKYVRTIPESVESSQFEIHTNATEIFSPN